MRIHLRHAAAVLAVISIALVVTPRGALAQGAETVSVGGSNVVVIKPKRVRASIVLLPGGDGYIGAGPGGQITRLRNNQLVRTRMAYVARGYAVMVADAGTNLASAVQYMAQIKRPVVVMGTSRGTLRAAQGIAGGARPDALILTSGFLSNESGSGNNVMSILGSPGLLPRTLVIHHRHDGCRLTLPGGVDPFLRWAGGRARVAWLDGGATNGNPCGGMAHHGFNGLDGQVVGRAASFR